MRRFRPRPPRPRSRATAADPYSAVPTVDPHELAGFAPAKVNLTLHVLGRRRDGYHELESLVVFADAGDQLTFVPGAKLDLAVRGRSEERRVGKEGGWRWGR